MDTDLRKTTKVRSREDLVYADLSYKITGILIEVYKELGPYAREKQYCDLLENKFKMYNLLYTREARIGDSGNIADFIIENKIILEIKTRPFLIAEHYDQLKRYLHETNLQLGLLVNFRTKFLQPKRILNIL